MQPLTILHLCSLTRWNGTVHLAAALCRRQAEAGHRVIVGARPESQLTARLTDRLAEGGGEATVEILEGLQLLHGLHPRALSGDLRRIRRCLREADVDVLHTWQAAETWIGAAARRGTATALFRTRSIMKPVRRHVAKRLLDRLPGGTLVTCSRIEAMVRDASDPGARIFPLREGVDLERFHPSLAAVEGRAVRAELGIGDDAVVAVNVGRLETIKGQAHFLRALAALPDHVHGVIAGEGSQREALAEVARAAGIDGRVHMLGRREDVPAVLAAGDVYVLSSIGSEGSSRATLEAMAAGLVPVVADVGMLPDLVEHGHTGFLFAAGDEAGLAARLREVVEDAEGRERMRRAARVHVEQHRSEAAMLRDVETAYRAEVHRARARAGRPLDPARDWDETTRILECDARVAGVGDWLADLGGANHLVLADEAHRAALASAAPRLAPKVHPYHGRGQAVRNNAQVLVLSGEAEGVLRRRTSFGHVDQFLVPARGAYSRAVALRVLSRTLRRRGTLGIPGPGGEVLRYRVFENGRRREKKRARLYLSEELGVPAFLAGLEERGLRHLVLRWFDELPDLEPGADIDLLIEDEDLDGLHEVLGGRVGTIPLDVYTVHGSRGHAWRGASYYPPPLAKEMLAASRVNGRGVRVPADEHAFLSLVYHALYHKGPRSGLPTSTPGVTPDAAPRHDFAGVFAARGEALGHRPPLTMEGLDEFLHVLGWRPARDTLRKWSRGNPWLRRRFFSDRAQKEPAGLATFVLRRAALELDLVEELRTRIRKEGFTIVDEKHLAPEETERIAQRTRGGNWGVGSGFTADGGPPAVFVVAHDASPLRLTRRYRRRYPDMDNGRLVCKRTIRDEVITRLPVSRRPNLLHVSDNAEEAWEYIRMAMPEREAAIRERLAALTR